MPPEYCPRPLPDWLDKSAVDAWIQERTAMLRTPKEPEHEPTEADAPVEMEDAEDAEDEEAKASAPIIRELVAHHWHFRHRREVREQIRCMIRRLREVR